MLAPEPGERMLEVGPGTGYYTLDVAEWVGPEGAVEILDVQQEMLDHTMRRAAERGLANVTPTLADATGDALRGRRASTPPTWSPCSGEIPDQDAAAARARAACSSPAAAWWSAS